MDVKDIIKVIVAIGQVADYYGIPDLGPCLTGHESKGTKCFKINRGSNTFSCFRCGLSGDVIRLVMLKEKLNFMEALKWLVGKYSPELLPRIGETGEPSAEEQERIEKGGLYDLVVAYGKKLLYEPRGMEALDYLVNVRGYAIENLKKTDWIYFPPLKEIRDHLLGFLPEATRGLKERINKLLMNEDFFDGFSRLAIPYRDRHRVITGFVKRVTQERPDGKRWDNSKGNLRPDLFNLYSCQGKKDLLLVEGYSDALYLTTLGLDNIVASGTTPFSKDYIEGLQVFNVKGVTIALDNNETGIENTEKAVETLQDTGIKVYVLDPPLMSPHEAPDKYVRFQGLKTFMELLDKAVTGSSWKLNRIIKRHNLTTDKGWDDALNEAIEYTGSLLDRQERKKCREIISNELNIQDEELPEPIEEYTNRKWEEDQRKGLLTLSGEISLLVSEGKPISEIQSFLSERVLDLRMKAGNRTIETYTLEALKDDIQKTPEGLKTVYRELDENLTIQPGTLSVIAGRPGHGKTTFMMNLLLNMVGKYRDKSFFFFSYEEPRRRLAAKPITISSQTIMTPNQNTLRIENYIKGNKEGVDKVDGAMQAYHTYTNENRLFLIDTPYFINDLAHTLASLTQRFNVGAVFIDSLERIKSDEKSPTRQLELQRISATLLESAVRLSIPIIVGVQVNLEVKSKDELRSEKIREAGDIEQKANIILGVWNEAQADHTRIVKDPVDFTVKVLKNRDGKQPFNIDLKFNRPLLTIRE
jgi:DNA primase catalytic core